MDDRASLRHQRGDTQATERPERLEYQGRPGAYGSDRHLVPLSDRPRVVIVGGGFAGLHCARALRKARVQITLIDARNFHLFQPLLYQVATASLSPADIASPIRNILRRQSNVETWLGRVDDVDLAAKTVSLSDGARISYDYLVLGTGVTHSYFGHPEWAELAPGLKTVEDALEIRRRFLLAFEAAERESDPDRRRRLLTFLIVGGGPTGVELAGAMAEISRQVMPKDFRAIDTSAARVMLVEGTSRVLQTYPSDLSASAQRQLEQLGVEVRTSTLVTDIKPDCVQVGEERIEAANIFWAAGVAASPISARLDVPLDQAGRVVVERDCSVPGHPEVFVAGDLASHTHNGEPVPGVAQGGIQMGQHAGRCIADDLAGRPRDPFVYKDKGSLATIGRSSAVARLGRFKFSGFSAWFLWVFIHIWNLIGFRNRVIVVVEWAWMWLTFSRGIRLITGSVGSLEAGARSLEAGARSLEAGARSLEAGGRRDAGLAANGQVGEGTDLFHTGGTEATE